MNTPKRIFVKPAFINGKSGECKKVRYPEHKRHLNDKGETVVQTSYWLRRAQDGDVHISTAPFRKPSKKKKTDKESAVEPGKDTGGDSV